METASQRSGAVRLFGGVDADNLSVVHVYAGGKVGFLRIDGERVEHVTDDLVDVSGSLAKDVLPVKAGQGHDDRDHDRRQARDMSLGQGVARLIGDQAAPGDRELRVDE